MIKAELRGWLPLIDIYLSEAEIKNVILESERSLSKYAKPSGEAVFPTSARVITGRKDEPGN